jgi:hypothetical protein
MFGVAFPGYDTDDTDWKDYGGGSIDEYPSGGGGLFLGMDFGLLAGEAGVLLVGDNGRVTMHVNSGGYSYSDSSHLSGVSLHIPLLVKGDFHLGPVVLQPFLGPYFNIALGELDVKGNEPYANPLLGLVFGGLLGLNLGRGILFLDGRYAIDLGRTVAGNDPITIWRRSVFMLNMGYQIYLGRRK